MALKKNIKKATKLNNLQLEAMIKKAYRSAQMNSMFCEDEKAEEQKRLGDWLKELKDRREKDE